MSSPKLSTHQSGYGGRGYADIFGINGGNTLMSVTTAISALDKPGIRQWERQQVAAYAVTHVEDLISRSEEVGYRYLMAVPKFLTPEKVDELDPDINVWNAPEYALNEAAEAGTWMHTYVEDHLSGRYTEDPWRDDQYQMVEAFHEWEAEHDIEVLSLERTVYGDNYAGTADLFARIDGMVTLVDWKTSAAVRESHKMQLAAIGASITTALEVPEGTPGSVAHKLQPKVSAEHGGQEVAWFREEPLPDFERYCVVQIRPGDYDNRGTYVEPFCKMHEIPHAQIETAYKLFRAAVDARLAQRELKALMKEEEA